MIAFDGVYFSYNSHTILKDLSFLIDTNERVAVLGGSGEGKTTILRLIMGLLKPDRGKILIDGEDISRKTERELRRIRMKFSIVFQEGALFDSMSVKENVAFYLREYTKMSEVEIDRRVRQLLGVVDLEPALTLMPEELSGGMQRRAALARSLAAADPEMFLYDEPTSGLDPISADRICKLILDLARNSRGFIIVTHKMTDAVKVADRFMFLMGGKLIFDGNKSSLMKTNLPELKIYLGELCAL